MPELSDHERDQLPDHNEMDRVSDREFKIHKVDTKQEVFWIEDERNRYISFILSHIDPESELGNMVQKLPESDYVTLSGVRLKKGDGYIPRWYLTGISDVGEGGSHKNVFEG